MIYLAVLLLGLLLPIAFPSQPIMIFMIGIIAGCGVTVFENIRVRPQPIYIKPVDRPRPSTRRGNLLAAAITAVGGALFLLLVFNLPTYMSPVWRLNGLYLGGFTIGIALAILLTERRVRERGNKWLDAMNPRPSSEDNWQAMPNSSGEPK